MSSVLPYTEAQAADWQTRGPEPVLVTAPGWSQVVSGGGLPNERVVLLQCGAARVHMNRWWDLPLRDGGPTQVRARRVVRVAGADQSLLACSMFQGRQSDASVLFLRGSGWLVRFAFHGCSDAQIDAVLSGVRIGG